MSWVQWEWIKEISVWIPNISGDVMDVHGALENFIVQQIIFPIIKEKIPCLFIEYPVKNFANLGFVYPNFKKGPLCEYNFRRNHSKKRKENYIRHLKLPLKKIDALISVLMGFVVETIFFKLQNVFGERESYFCQGLFALMYA